MRSFDIITRSVFRRKGKYLFLLLVIVFGVTITTGLTGYSEAMHHEINHKMEKYGANILILPRMESLPLTYGGISLGSFSYEMARLRQGDLKKISKIKNSGNIAAVGAFLLGVVKVEGTPVLLCGIETETVPVLRPWWKINGSFKKKGKIVSGSEAARLLKLKPGGRLMIKRSSLSVSGVLNHTGSQDDNILFTDLATAQRLLNQPGMISFAEAAALCSGCPIEEMVRQISGVLPAARVSGIKQVIGSRMQSLAMIRTFAAGTSGVVALLSLLVITAVMMSNVRDRIAELGLYRAIGFQRTDLAFLVMGEIFLVSLAAGTIGYGGGIFLANGIMGLTGDGGAVTILPELVTGLLTIGVTILVALTAGILPSRTAMKLDPVTALRHL